MKKEARVSKAIGIISYCNPRNRYVVQRVRYKIVINEVKYMNNLIITIFRLGFTTYTQAYRTGHYTG